MPDIEGMYHHAAGLLQMPAPLLREATERYGQHARTIVDMQQHRAASLPSLMRRWVNDDPAAHRTAFTTSGSYIADTADSNIYLPCWRLDRVAEVTLTHPEVQAVSVGRRQALGVMSW